MPHAFQLPCLCMLRETEYAIAVRECIRLGGCSASRAAFVGACIAAYKGRQSVPAGWIAQVEQGDAVLELADRLVANRQ